MVSMRRSQSAYHRQLIKALSSWEQKCWHLGNRRFAREADAGDAAERELKAKLGWLDLHLDLVAHPQYAGKGRPSKDTSPVSHQWQIVTTFSLNQAQVAQEAFRNACWIVGTNVMEPTVLSDQQLIATSKGQHGAERRCGFLTDLLFLASSFSVQN